MRKFVLLLCFTFYGCIASAQEITLPFFISDSLENYIARGMTEWHIPGLSVAIVKDGEVVYIKGFGVTKFGSTQPVNENTLFMIGANTKAFTATALTILQAEGKLNIEDKVQKWMPEFSLKDSFASKEITIADLLSHRTGFETFQENFLYWKSNLSRAEIIQKMSLVDAPFGLRTEWGYCNAAFVAAGELIPRITGRSWEETVKEKILSPLKMTRTLMLSSELIKASNKSFPHTIIDDKITLLPYDSIDNLGPAGSMSSSAKDMSVWLMAQLDNGTIEGKQVIPYSAIRAIRKPYSIIGMDTKENLETHFHLYGLGLIINDRNEKLVYSHAGGIDGFLSYVMFVPEDRLGIVVLTNSDQNMFFEDLANEIRDAFLNLPYRDYSDNSLFSFNYNKTNLKEKINSLRKEVKSNNKPELPLETYTGTYKNEVYGNIEIQTENKHLVIRFSHHPDLIGRLEYIKNNSFLCTYSDPKLGIVEIPFKMDKDKVAGLTLHVAEAVDTSTYEFVKTN